MRFKYEGEQRVQYPFYLDVTDPEHPQTLVAEPGQTYEIKQAEGHQVLQDDGQFTDAKLPMPPDDHWTKADAKSGEKKKES